MPNYCDNYLTIEGNENTIKTIMELVRSEDNAFDFNKIIPMPDNIYQGNVGQKERELYGENNWYDWSCKNWGTKWNSVDAEAYDNDFVFQTAWSPADPVIAALAKMFPAVRFTYTFSETGMCFCGKRVFENGKLVFAYDGDIAENYDWESDDSEYDLKDDLFPIKESGFLEEYKETEDNGICLCGNFHYREYGNNKIIKITDGNFVAERDYWHQLPDKEKNYLLYAA